MVRDRLRLAVAVLLLAGTALFVVGSVIEHRDQGEGGSEAGLLVHLHTEFGEEAHLEGGEEAHNEPTEGNGEQKLFGLDIEAPLAVTGAAIATAALALLVLFVRSAWPLVLGILLGLGYGALDVREALHQQDEGRTGIAAIAWSLLLIHLAVAILSAVGLNRSRGRRTAPA